MEVHEAVLVDRADGSELRLTRQLSGAEIAALQADARTIYQKKMDQGAEILQLGPLTEEPREDGVQRFHASEVLSVMADGWYTARGYDGIDAVLEYMTGDTVVNTQRIRFAEECIPALQERYGELLTPYADRFAGNPELSLRDVYGALGELKETLGSVFLEVPKLTSEQHTVMDPLTELKLDVGEERVMPPLDPNAED
jgi:hypothetical protein